MTRKIKISELQEFDITEYLTTDEDVAAYLTVVLEENDPDRLVVALQDIARARALSGRPMNPSGIVSATLAKSPPLDQSPRFDVVSKICAALGLKLVAIPLHAA